MSPLASNEFYAHLKRCVMSESEIRTFVRDIVQVRLLHTVEGLEAVANATNAVISPLQSELGIDWSDPALLALSGVDSTWIQELSDPTDPGKIFLHIDTADRGDWSLVRRYVEQAMLSEKQRTVLLPLLSLAQRRKQHQGRSVTRARLAEEVRLLNGMLRWVGTRLDIETFRRYQAHLTIDGRSRNTSGIVGHAGATVAILDAIEEAAPGQVRDIHGNPLASGDRTPAGLFEHLYGSEARAKPLQSLLLANGRAIVFPRDPDIAIFQSLGTPYTSALQAWEGYESVRNDASRRHLVHEYALGEVKVATDRQSLHERAALGGRDLPREVRADRFLVMAILDEPFLLGKGGGRRRRSPFIESSRFDHIFNLYFAWGYDGSRSAHPDHWSEFKRQIAAWCGLL